MDEKFAKQIQKALSEWTAALEAQEKADAKVRTAKNRVLTLLMSQVASIFAPSKTKSKFPFPVM